MKIYHKFLLYQNKWIHPYTRIILGGVTYIAYLASILLIMGVVYEHGFTISEHEASQLQTLYRFVWGVFLSEVTLRLLLEYRDTKRTFKKLTWILIALLYLTLIPVIFHRPEEEGAILHFWEILNGKPYHIVLLLIFSFLNLSNGLVRVLGRRTNPSLILAGSFLIIIALLLLIEVLDRTLRDANRTKRVTGFKVIGAVPSPSSSRYGGLAKTYVQLSIKELSNSILRFLTKRKSPGVFIINLFSTSENSGEDIVGNLICGYMQSRMLNTRFITYGEDFNTDSTQYLLAKNITDFYTLQGEDILIVAYPPLSSSNIPTALLHDANVNILVSPADRGWKTIDKQLCEQLTTQMGKTDVPFRVCLTNAKREAVEDFTGQLPPYTLLRRVSYRFSQLSLTEKIIFNLSRKAKETEEDDDE